MRTAPGEQLRSLRESLGLTVRDVEAASERIAKRHRDDEFLIPISRLSHIETKGIVPSIQRLYTLAVIYRMDIRELMALYGIDLNDAAADVMLVEIPKTHRTPATTPASAVRVPVRLDPSFNINRTSNLGRLIERWGVVPLTFLEEFTDREFTYGFVGIEDFSMYPLLLPGSFIQVDESRSKVVTGPWRSEFERPIYFVETREGFTCCWCEEHGDRLLLQPHPLSPASTRLLHRPGEVDVIGQVVGVAMRLDFWRYEAERAQKTLH
ncbi:MAG TPA: helix-turn-helix transcriptional regulator [Terriglobales bacterium]|nr:helix-turn-helix transcriptional regulator [Terriglobales bacterium]